MVTKENGVVKFALVGKVNRSQTRFNIKQKKSSEYAVPVHLNVNSS